MYLAKKSFHFSVQKLIFDINIWNHPVYPIICSQKNTQLNKVNLSAKKSVCDTSERIMRHEQQSNSVSEHFLSKTHSSQSEGRVNDQDTTSCQYTKEYSTEIYYPDNNRGFLRENTEEQVVDELIPMIEPPLSNIETNPQYNTRNLSKTNTEQHLGSIETIKKKHFFQSAAESYDYYKKYAFHQCLLPPVCTFLGYEHLVPENPFRSKFDETDCSKCDNLVTQYHFKNDISSQFSEYQPITSNREYQTQKNSSALKRKMDNTSDGSSHNKVQTLHKDAMSNDSILSVDTPDRQQNLNYVTRERPHNNDTNCYQSVIDYQKQQQDNTSQHLRSKEYKSGVKSHDSSVYSAKCSGENTKINQTSEYILSISKSAYTTIQKKFILHDVQEDKNFFKTIDEISNQTVIKAVYIKSPKTISSVGDQKTTSDKLFSLYVQLKRASDETGALVIHLSIMSVPVFLIPEYSNHQYCDNFKCRSGKSKQWQLYNDITIVFASKIQTGICVADILPEFVFISGPNFLFFTFYKKKICDLRVSNTKSENDLSNNKNFTRSNRTKSQKVKKVAKIHELIYFLKRLDEYEQKIEEKKQRNLFINIIIKKMKLLRDHLEEMSTDWTFSEDELKNKLRQIRIFKKEFEINENPSIFSGVDSPEAHDLKAAYLKVNKWFVKFVKHIPRLEDYLN